jgi:hypothetical protein
MSQQDFLLKIPKRVFTAALEGTCLSKRPSYKIMTKSSQTVHSFITSKLEEAANTIKERHCNYCGTFNYIFSRDFPAKSTKYFQSIVSNRRLLPSRVPTRQGKALRLVRYFLSNHIFSGNVSAKSKRHVQCSCFNHWLLPGKLPIRLFYTEEDRRYLTSLLFHNTIQPHSSKRELGKTRMQVKAMPGSQYQKTRQYATAHRGKLEKLQLSEWQSCKIAQIR